MVHNTPDSPESQLIGGPIQENKEKVAKANPITYVTKDDAPFLTCLRVAASAKAGHTRR